MYQMSYLVPSNHPPVDGALDMDIMRMTASMKGVDQKFVNVPNSALWINLIMMTHGSSLEIKKYKELVYINLFCFEEQKRDIVLSAVHDLYEKYSLGKPKRPPLPTWIHSIPVATSLLRENEYQLCHKMTVSYYWAVYAQILKKRNRLN